MSPCLCRRFASLRRVHCRSAYGPPSVRPPHRLLIPLNLDFPLRNRDVARIVDSLRLAAAAATAVPCRPLGVSARGHVRQLRDGLGLDNKHRKHRRATRRGIREAFSVVWAACRCGCSLGIWLNPDRITWSKLETLRRTSRHRAFHNKTPLHTRDLLCPVRVET